MRGPTKSILLYVCLALSVLIVIAVYKRSWLLVARKQYQTNLQPNIADRRQRWNKSHPEAKLRLTSQGKSANTTQTSEVRPRVRPIPRILHQVYKDKNIPKIYIPSVTSWIKNHPTWKYMFWSDQDARMLIQDHYPDYLEMYDHLGSNLQRSDAARYFILYHYGGVYADMDMDSIRPLDDLLSNYSGKCVFAREPSIESLFLYRARVVPMNAFMICIKHHQFMRFVIENLKNHPLAPNVEGAAVSRTGPLMLQKVLAVYKERTKCGKSSAKSCDVIVAASSMFMPVWDPAITEEFQKSCKNIEDIPYSIVEVCFKLRAMNYTSEIPKDAYANHLFLHIGWANGRFEDRRVVDISKTVPLAVRYISADEQDE